MGLEADLAAIVSSSGAALTPLSRGSFDSEGAEKRLRDLFAVGTLDAFGTFSRAERSAMIRALIVDGLAVRKAAKIKGPKK